MNNPTTWEDYELLVPRQTIETIRDYINRGIPTGSFVRAVLENNLMEAMMKADEHNRRSIFWIVSMVYNLAPAQCWGSPQEYRAWLDFKRKEVPKT
jgi:hypothetical protein